MNGNKTKYKWFVGIVIVQALILLGIAGTSYAAEWLGREIRLQTVPVDPRDLFYGDYVILDYEISRMDPAMWKGEGSFPENGKVVYVAMAPAPATAADENDIYAPVAVYPNRVSVPPEQVLVRGIVSYSWEEEIGVRYGIERYYVPEGTGLELERQSRDGQLIVSVKVAPWGQSVVTGVFTKSE